MWALATVDLKGKYGQALIFAFPECFSEEEQEGPYPLSLIREEAHRKGLEEANPSGGDLPISYYSIPDHILVKGFDKTGENIAGLEGQMLPEGIDPNAKQGEVVEWGGKKFVVLENNTACEEFWIAPAECILVDCPIASDES